MSTITANGEVVTALSMTLQRIGPWHADVTLLPSAEVPEGHVTISSYGVAYQGTVLRSGRTQSLPFARVIGGAGGFGRVLPAKAYREVDAKLPLSEVLTAVGEVLSPKSDLAALRAFWLRHWVRFESKAGEALASLLTFAGIPAWRVLADGTTWVGTETWPVSALKDFLIISEDPHLGCVKVFADTRDVFPGETWNGRHVSRVEHRFSADKLLTRLWLEDA